MSSGCVSGGAMLPAQVIVPVRSGGEMNSCLKVVSSMTVTVGARNKTFV